MKNDIRTWIKVVAVVTDNWLYLRSVLKVEMEGLGGGTNRDLREKSSRSFELKKYKAYILFIQILQNTLHALYYFDSYNYIMGLTLLSPLQIKKTQRSQVDGPLLTR